MKKLVPSIVLSDPEHRYRLAAERIIGCKNILDVGGYDDRRSFIEEVVGKDFAYTAVNRSSAWYGNVVQSLEYNGKKLPFKDNQFEVAISVDTLEHIPPDQRKHWIDELIRVSRRAVLVVPFSDSSRPTLE